MSPMLQAALILAAVLLATVLGALIENRYWRRRLEGIGYSRSAISRMSHGGGR